MGIEQVDQIKESLDRLEGCLGHYSEIGGPDCPYHKTNDNGIKAEVAIIRDILLKGI